MKRYIAFLFLSTLSLRAELEFSGFFITPNAALYSLTDTDARVSSGWLKIGQTYRGHTVVSFDRATETLTLKKDEQLTRLRLREAKVKDGRTIINGTITLSGGERLEGVWATLFMDEEAAFPLKDGLTFFLKPQRHDDGNILYRARFIARGKDGKDETLAAPAVVALPGHPFSIQVGDLGYAFTPATP